MKKLLYLILLVCLAAFEAGAQELNIIPRPNEIELAKGQFELGSAKAIQYTSEAEKEAAFLQAALQERYNMNLLTNSGKGKKNTISLELDKKLSKDLGGEGYRLTATPTQVAIQAATTAGIYYGVQSLLQAIYTSGENHVLPAVVIEDKPRFSWRAFMLDEARHFKGKEEVKLLLDEMARLKMNTFHWHLVDDQGWRIEIKKYPKLTEVGSVRKSTQVGERKWNSNKQSGEPHSGFYTQKDIKEIVAYAAERHINVVPEIEMPGHSSAAIAAYPWLGTNNQKIEVPVKFGRFYDIYDVTSPKVQKFFHDVLQEVFTLFPSRVIHVGGDEVGYEAWEKSQQVNAYMKEHGIKTYADLQVHFTNNISRYIEQNGRRMMGWNEIMGINIHPDFEEKKADANAETQLAKNVVVHFWKGDVKLITQAASKGYQLVNSLHSMSYLDYDFGAIPLQKAYSFDPVPQELKEEYHQNIIGTGSQMWSEWIPTRGEMHYQVFPRLAAYAEVGWTQPHNKSYKQFRQALLPLLKVWEGRGIHFAPLSDVERAENQ
ncbi:hexosaminidase [Pontibacter ummariensis]|uniref:beta-N-acetylhexosaminidase n=1 Tax=Pontibacter ummariensis TaxID=1610492 RepID=A0A239LPQ6_9BACT|nr:beta-N-acetylhexosaminidase [Pontibacter ummariensis]PRY02911.1 hexosaminidase [Pontibacter ummariensis]SNT32431.1 hexosaminidase [Pontibacter ummariensis]